MIRVILVGVVGKKCSERSKVLKCNYLNIILSHQSVCLETKWILRVTFG